MSYADMAPAADKLLQPDGSIITYAGDLVLPPDADRALQYTLMSPKAAKFLLPDGSVVSEMPGSGGGIIIGDEEFGLISNLKISQIIQQVFGN